MGSKEFAQANKSIVSAVSGNRSVYQEVVANITAMIPCDPTVSIVLLYLKYNVLLVVLCILYERYLYSCI